MFRIKFALNLNDSLSTVFTKNFKISKNFQVWLKTQKRLWKFQFITKFSRNFFFKLKFRILIDFIWQLWIYLNLFILKRNNNRFSMSNLYKKLFNFTWKNRKTSFWRWFRRKTIMQIKSWWNLFVQSIKKQSNNEYYHEIRYFVCKFRKWNHIHFFCKKSKREILS